MPTAYMGKANVDIDFEPVGSDGCMSAAVASGIIVDGVTSN